MWNRLWQDEAASVITTEVILLTTLLILGIVVGAKSFRDSAVTEWADYAQAIANIDQSYNVPDGATTGSGFVDRRDFCDTEAVDHGPSDSSNDGTNIGDGTLNGIFDDGIIFQYGVAAEEE